MPVTVVVRGEFTKVHLQQKQPFHATSVMFGSMIKEGPIQSGRCRTRRCIHSEGKPGRPRRIEQSAPKQEKKVSMCAALRERQSCKEFDLSQLTHQELGIVDLRQPPDLLHLSGRQQHVAGHHRQRQHVVVVQQPRLGQPCNQFEAISPLLP